MAALRFEANEQTSALAGAHKASPSYRLNDAGVWVYAIDRSGRGDHDDEESGREGKGQMMINW